MLLSEVIFKLIEIKAYRWQSACHLSQIASRNGDWRNFQACPWNSRASVSTSLLIFTTSSFLWLITTVILTAG